MSKELAVAALSKKITSLEAFEAALLEGKIISGSLARHTTSGSYGVRSTLSAVTNVPLIAMGSFSFHGAAEIGDLYRIHDAYRSRVTEYVPMHLWWLVRERLRMVFGVYPPATSMIEQINSMNATFPFAVHVSTVDPSKIAYTPSEQDGIADRQLSTTIGKFLKKHLIVLSDEEVQMIDAAHRADLSNELEIVTGAAQIQEVYTNMIGDSGCMRYSPSHFNLPDNLHPSIVYDAPGVGVAVLRDGEGNVKARSVVYVNPNNPNDKRYVRLYGDGMLKRRLERNGFECKTLLDVTLRAVPHPKLDHTNGERIIAPYIDGAGGNTGEDGRYGVLTDQGIMMVSADDARELQRIHGSDAAVYMTGTSGVYKFKKVAADWFMETSPLTGVKYDARKVSRVKAFLPDGRAEMVPEGEIDQATWKLYMTYNITRSGRHERVWGQANLPTFQQYGETYVDTEAQRVALGWERLCADFYPNEQEWIRADSDEHVALPGGKLIRRKDAAIVITTNADGVQARDTMHHTQVSEGLTQVWGFNSMRVFVGEGVGVHVTPSKRKVVPGFHEVVKMYDGVYDFRRNTKQVRVFGHELIVPRHLDIYDVDVTKAVQLLATVGTYARRSSRDEAIRYLRMMLTRSHYSYVFREGQWEGQYGTSALVHSNDPANVLATKAKLDTLTDDEIAAIASSNCTAVASIKWWVNSAAALVNKFNELVAEYDAARDAASSMATVDITNVDSLISSRFSTARFSLAA